MLNLIATLASIAVLWFANPARAEVVRIVVEQRQPLKAQAQPYEKLTGHFFGELDPRNPLNALITDIESAPRNASGLVEYSATFTILKPIDMATYPGVLVYQVPNRGRAGIEGGGYLADFRARGYVIVASGWQADVAPQAGVETVKAPFARKPDGSSLTGPVFARFLEVPAGTTTQPIMRGRMPGTATPASLDTDKATLTRRATEEGRRSVLKPDEWAFADCRTVPFPGKPDPGYICLRDKFNPASLYELSYVAKDPVVAGIGLAATRDLIAFLRQAGTDNPIGRASQHAIALGSSQAGNLLKAFLHLGFNQDLQGRRVFDGVHSNIAVRTSAINTRFASPSGASEMFEPGSEGPQWWGDYTDEARGRTANSLSARCQATNTCPKVVETFGSAEFYSLRASPGLVGIRADRDIPLPVFVRRYYLPGVRHGGGRGGFEHKAKPEECCELAENVNPSSETNRALIHALVEWVINDTPPPPSRYPRLDRGDLVAPTRATTGFPAIPGQPIPDGILIPFFDYDFGPGFGNEDESGVMSLAPPVIRGTFPTLVPRVDADGNETAGVPSVLLQAALGTYTGWNIAKSGFFAGRIERLVGGYIPFARTKAERLAANDPRLSLEERYRDHAGYVARVRGAAERLVRDGFLLADDAKRLVAEAEASSVLK